LLADRDSDFNTKETSSNAAARNALVRNDPASIKLLIREKLQNRVAHSGRQLISGCVILWKPAFVPFHIEYTLDFLGKGVQVTHLASAKVFSVKNPVSTHSSLL